MTTEQREASRQPCMTEGCSNNDCPVCRYIASLEADRERLDWMEEHATADEMRDIAERFATGRDIRVVIDNAILRATARVPSTEKDG